MFGWIKRKLDSSIRMRISMLAWMALIPAVILCIYLIALMSNYRSRYDRIVQNITLANEYNISFETNMNDSMYYIVTGAYDWPELTKAGQSRNPYTMIDSMRSRFIELENETSDRALRSQIGAIRRLLDILESRVDDIIANVEEGGHFDENKEMLDSNIYILTDLIQGDIEQYITKEAADMEIVRQDMSAQIRANIYLVISLLFVYLVGVLILSDRLSKRLTQPIAVLCDKTEEFAQGDFAVRFESANQDEIGTLGKHFNSMVEEIAQLVDDVREEQRNLQDTELRLLQAQINPHFLYNTLDAIMWLTEAGEKKEAVSMLSSLSEFFRTTLSSGRDYVTLEEEDNHIRSYLNIQRFRYQDIMDYRIAFDEDILPFYIQKMTLQPIVENALYHGIKNKRGMGLIEVEGHSEGGDIILTVRDNGIGMTKEQLTHLRNVLEGREAAEQEWNGFGMVNVQKRIRLGFGSDYGLTVGSVYGEGCTVTVRIPAVESDAVRQKGQRTERPIISGSLLQEGGEEAYKA